MRNVSKVLEKVKTHFMLNFCFFKNHAVYKIKLKKFVEPGRPQVTIWRMRILCWIPKATNTLSEYVLHNVFPRQ